MGSSKTTVPANWPQRLQVPKLRRIPVKVVFNDSSASDLKLSVSSTPRTSYGATITIRHAVDLDPDGMGAAAIQDEAILRLRNTSDKPTDMYLSQGRFQNSTALEKLSVSFGKGVRVTGRAVSTDGKPAARIGLIAISDLATLSVSTDAEGRFKFTGPPGRMLLVPAG